MLSKKNLTPSRLNNPTPPTVSVKDGHNEHTIPTPTCVHSRVVHGIDAKAVRIEAHISHGLPAFHIIGLPEKSIKESKERVRSALLNAGFRMPDRHITVNLAPAQLPKWGSHLDLPIALSILIASKQIQATHTDCEYYGELSLSGAIRPMSHTITHALACHRDGRGIVVPIDNRHEGAIIEGLKVYGCSHLLDACALMQGHSKIRPTPHATRPSTTLPEDWPSIDDVRGQGFAKRALLIACAGGHNLIMRGPPGTGKTLLAQCARRLQSPLALEEQQGVMRIHATRTHSHWITARPFRQPHHSATMAAMIGGGQPVTVGEASLAHHGILLLDEIAEFKPQVLDSLREPLESGVIHFARAGMSMAWPANFQLIATCNPCPCGYYTPHTSCRCTLTQIQRYQARLSGPLWDRMDIGVEVNAPTSESSSPWRQQSGYQMVLEAQARQIKRQGKLNAKLSARPSQSLRMEEAANQTLDRATQTLQLSMRAKQRTLRVARTIADLDKQDTIEKGHIQEALSLRPIKFSE